MKIFKVHSFRSNKLLSFTLALLLMVTFTPVHTFAATVVKPTGTLHGKVTNVVDGDAFKFRTLDNKSLIIKIAGIDTTENPDAYALLKSVLQGKNVKVEIINLPIANIQPYSYGVVYIGNTDISKPMLQSGLAEYNPATISATYKNSYIIYQNEAKRNKEGMWNY